MVRKAVSFTLILTVLFFAYQFLINLAKSEHSISYVIDAKETYNIDEDYIKSSGLDYYLIKVTVGDKAFVFDVENTFNKQKKIVEDVVSFDEDGLYCISLIYKNKKSSSEPLCYYNDVLSSYSSVKNVKDLSEYVAKLPGFDLDKYDKDSEKKAQDDIVFNRDYLTDNEVIAIYSYKKVNFIDKYFDRYFIFSNKDNYKNILGALVGEYYLIPRFTSEATFTSYIKYDLVDGIKKEIKTGFNISKQSYINGVYDGKLYIFDRSNMKQYEIDPAHEKVVVVGDEKNEGFAYINGEEKRVSVYELNSNNLIFSEKTEQFNAINYDKIFADNYYAIYKKGNDYYKVYTEHPEVSIYLFSDANAKEEKVKDGSIYYVRDNGIYRYNKYGNKLLATKDELRYNYENVFDIFMRED